MGNSSSSSDLVLRQVKAKSKRVKRKTCNPEYDQIYRGNMDGFHGRNNYSNGYRDHDTEMTDNTEGPTSFHSQRDKKLGYKALSSRALKSKYSPEEVELPPVTVFGTRKFSNQNKGSSKSSSNNPTKFKAKEANRNENADGVHSISSRKIPLRGLPPNSSSQKINSSSNAKPASNASTTPVVGTKKFPPTSRFISEQLDENDLLSHSRINEAVTGNTLENVDGQKPFFQTNATARSAAVDKLPTIQAPVLTKLQYQTQPIIPAQSYQMQQSTLNPPTIEQFQQQWLQQQQPYYHPYQNQPYQQFCSPSPFPAYNVSPYGLQHVQQHSQLQPLPYPSQEMQSQQYTAPYNAFSPALQPGFGQLNYPFNGQIAVPAQPNHQLPQVFNPYQQSTMILPPMQQLMPYPSQMQMTPMQIQTPLNQQSFAQVKQGVSQSTNITPVQPAPAPTQASVPMSSKTITTTASAQAPEVSSDDRTKYAKYFTMKKMRVPEGGIRNKMIMDGLTDADMDYFFSLQ